MLHKCPNAGCSKTFFFKRNMTCSNCDGSKRTPRVHSTPVAASRYSSNDLTPEALYAQQNAMQLNNTLLALESSDSSKDCKSSDDSHIRRNQCEDTPSRTEPSYTHSHSHSSHDHSSSSTSSSSDSWSSSSYSSDSSSSYDSGSSSSSSDSSW